MTEREALKLALEALEEPKEHFAKHRRLEAITAIKDIMAQPEQEYERGFIDGMQKQMQSSVDKAVNRLAQRTWVGLTDDEIDQGLLRSDYAFKTAEAWRAGVVFAMTKLKEKNCA